MAELTPIRIEPQLKLEIKDLIKEGYFSTMTEFVKDAIRKNLENYRKQRALKTLELLRGSSKGFSPNKNQRKEFFKEFEKEIIGTLEKQ